MSRLLRAASLLVCVLTLAATAQAAGPWTGRIVDFDTGEPLQGVVVLAVWERTVPGIVEAVDRFHRAYETVTDRDGYFEIPAYTAINLLPFISPIHGPYTTYFKPGYLAIPHGESSHLLPDASQPVIERKYHYKFRFGAHYLALPKLKTRKERKQVILRLPPCCSIPDNQMRNLIKLMNQEEIFLGFEPTHTNGDKE